MANEAQSIRNMLQMSLQYCNEWPEKSIVFKYRVVYSIKSSCAIVDVIICKCSLLLICVKNENADLDPNIYWNNE